MVAADLSAKEVLVEARATESQPRRHSLSPATNSRMLEPPTRSPPRFPKRLNALRRKRRIKLAALSKRIESKANRLRADQVLALRLSEAKERQRVNKLVAEAEAASALARTTRGAVQGYERILAEASTKAATTTTILNREFRQRRQHPKPSRTSNSPSAIARARCR